MQRRWSPLGQPILATGKTIQVWLEPSPQGGLRLSSRRSPFPQGRLALLISNWPQTSHWTVPATVEDGMLCADLQGSQCAFDRGERRALLVSLAVEGEGGITRYPLRAARLKKAMNDRKRCLFLHDERKWFSDPADSFQDGSTVLETVPGYVMLSSNAVGLGLRFVPRPLRYWNQLRYGLTELSAGEEGFLCAAKAAKNAPPLLGFALHRMDAAPGTQRFFPLEGEKARIPFSALPGDGGEYFLSGVCRREGETLFYAPLSVLEPQVHQALGERCNGIPVPGEGGRLCWLRLDELCTPSFTAATLRPGGERLPQGTTPEQAMLSGTLPVQGRCCVRDLGGGDWTLRLELPELVPEAEQGVYALAAFQMQRVLLPVKVLPGGGRSTVISVDCRPILEQTQSSRASRWELSLAFRMQGVWYHQRMRCPERMVRRNLDVAPEYLDYTRAFGGVIGVGALAEGSSVSALLNCLLLGECRLQLQDEVKTFEQQVTCRMDQAELRGKTLRLRMRCPNVLPGRWTGLALVHRYKLEADRAVHFVPATAVRQEGDVTWMEFAVDLGMFEFTPLYWDFRAVLEDDSGRAYHVRVLARRTGKKKNRLQRLADRVEHILHTDSYRQGKDWSVSLYRTAAFGYALVCQEYSPYSGLAFRLKERLALVIHRLFRRRLAAKSIFLVYEKYCCMAQDNGFYFFRHCMEQGMEEKMHRSIYFVIDKKQPDYRERLLPYRSHVIQFMSLKHMVYILASRLLISSDSKAHAYAWRAKESVILPRIEKRKKLVFLQHGVIALKRVEFYSKGTNAVQLFVTSNQREHDIIVKEMDYPDEDVIITGLARWDVLEDSGQQEKHILVMPTWRNWLEEVSDAAFMTSDYYRSYMALLNDPAMGTLLERYDLHLDFYIHPKFRDYISNFSIGAGERVRLIPFGTQPLNQLIMGCKMLITDYSSVCWDVYYQGKPVVFYQFDVEQYNESTGSYIDMETELFGDRAMKPEELLALMEDYARRDFALPRRYAEMRPKMYAYLDHNNSQRICEEIMKRHW